MRVSFGSMHVSGLKSTCLQPWTGHRDVVSGSLALGLDQDWKIGGILAVPRLEWLEDLETVGGWRDGNVDLGAVLWRSLVGVHTRVVSVGWKTITGWRLELELLAVLVLEGVGERVEVEGTSQGHGDNEIWRGDESVGSVVGIVATSEVTVVGRDDRVLLALLNILTVPLTNAWTTGVCENHSTKLLKSLELTVTLDCRPDLL